VSGWAFVILITLVVTAGCCARKAEIDEDDLPDLSLVDNLLSQGMGIGLSSHSSDFEAPLPSTTRTARADSSHGVEMQDLSPDLAKPAEDVHCLNQITESATGIGMGPVHSVDDCEMDASNSNPPTPNARMPNCVHTLDEGDWLLPPDDTASEDTKGISSSDHVSIWQ
jgi:hypothetical protein